MLLWLLPVTFVIVFALLFLLRRRSERALVQDWSLVLTKKGQHVYETVEDQVSNELRLMSITLEQAHASRAMGSLEDAIKLVEVGYKVIERFSPNMLKLLATMAVFSRMVSAMIPVEPLRPADFKLRQIVTLAYLNRVVHAFLVTAGDRFRLRLYVIGHGIGVAMRYLVRSVDGIMKGRSRSAEEWTTIGAVQADLQALSEESLRSFRVLLASLSSERPDVMGRFQP